VQIETAAAMRAWCDAQINAGARIALVPTMGYLHEGHLALVREARRHADRVVVSIFVNPTQFGPSEDLDRYPSDLQGDLRKLDDLGVDAVFTPAARELYPEGFATYVVPERFSEGLCGAARPGHFRGVATVVLLFFRITRCHVALFGEKDFQQLRVIRAMAEDLWLDVDVRGVATVREADGLAMSSRNSYLSAEQRAAALVLPQTLQALVKRVGEGERDAMSLAAWARQRIEEAPGVRLDYLELVDADSLRPLASIDGPVRCIAAMFVGETRLIDNLPLEPPP